VKSGAEKFEEIERGRKREAAKESEVEREKGYERVAFTVRFAPATFVRSPIKTDSKTPFPPFILL